MFLVGWIPLWGHAVEELKSDQSFDKAKPLLSSQGQWQCFNASI